MTNLQPKRPFDFYPRDQKEVALVLYEYRREFVNVAHMNVDTNSTIVQLDYSTLVASSTCRVLRTNESHINTGFP